MYRKVTEKMKYILNKLVLILIAAFLQSCSSYKFDKISDIEKLVHKGLEGAKSEMQFVPRVYSSRPEYESN